jgi:hypothetical protein
MCIQTALVSRLVILVLAIPCTVKAKTWTVDPNGTGDFMTIQRAVDAAAPGDVIDIMPGRYTDYAPYDFGARTEDTYVVVNKPNLTLRGRDRNAVIIGPEIYDWPSAQEPNGIQGTSEALGLIVESLTVENVPTGIGLEARAIVRDCTISGCYDAAPIFSWEAPRFEGCRIAGSRRGGIGYWAGSRGAVVTGCELDGFFSNVIFSASQDALLEGCTFFDEAYTKFQSSSTGIVRDCRFDTGGGILFLEADGTVEDTIVGPTPRVCLDVFNGNVTATRSAFRGGEDTTVLVRGHTNVVLSECHILNAGRWSVLTMNYPDSEYTLDFRNNYWGSADSTQITQWIYDGIDDPDNAPVVMFVPFAGSPVRSETETFGGLKALFSGKRVQ